MSDELFPSGPWTGFYTYAPQDKHRMDLHLTFTAGRISGDGTDDVGRFVIQGRYDAAERECTWTKTYPGSHDVQYRGFREGKGIWGTWEIGAGLWGHGGFHIWPRGLDEGEGRSEAIQESLPADAVGVEMPSASASVPCRTGAGSERPAAAPQPQRHAPTPAGASV